MARRSLLAVLFPDSYPKPRVRKKTGGKARTQLEERFTPKGVTVLGSGGRPFMTKRQYKAAKRVWPG